MEEVRSGNPGAATAPNRRRFLLTAALAALAPRGGFGPGGAALAAPGARAGGFVIVNGWVLTQADLSALADHAA